MPPVTFLIKPASSACNMTCSYCFYCAIAENRESFSTGMMRPETLETLVRKGLAYADDYCCFAFQGGEPTLAGLPFFEKLIELQKQYNTKNVRIQNCIQTNAYAIDDDWAAFLAKNDFLIGVSLDGPREIHDLNRRDRTGSGTFARVMKSIRTLERHRAQFNILSVVTGNSARHIRKIYQFYKKSGFSYLQFIPCLEPLEDERGSTRTYLSPDDYAAYLCTLFDLWYEDYINGRYISIRHIDNYIHLLMGHAPEACSMRGVCSVQLVVEGDGSVYPCDFYAYDEWRLGSILTDDVASLLTGDAAKAFLAPSRAVPEKCRACAYAPLCRNGCRRDRVLQDGILTNYYCEAYRRFFAHAAPRMEQVARMILAGRAPGAK